MRLTLIISSLGAGGAERVMSVMANHWVEHGREVTLITLASRKYDFYSLHHGVRRIDLGLTKASSNIASAVQNNLRRLQNLRQKIRASRPDVILSFGDTNNVLTLAASLGLGLPVVVSERNDPNYHDIGSIWAGLRRLLYPQAAALVVQTNRVRVWAERIVKSHAVHVIPNPVRTMLKEDEQATSVQSNGYRAVAMGRLATQKGFDLLLRAFAQCAAKHAGWSLVIVGEGQERQRLEALASELGIQDRVCLAGLVQEPVSILRGADLFVMSSRYEGFPNALVEAMACGCAVISTDCSSGPSDIIRDGIDGVLVRPDDIGSLAAAMDHMMGNELERQRVGAKALEVTERFSVEKIMKQWDELLTRVSICKAFSPSGSSCAKNRQAHT